MEFSIENLKLIFIFCQALCATAIDDVELLVTARLLPCNKFSSLVRRPLMDGCHSLLQVAQNASRDATIYELLPCRAVEFPIRRLSPSGLTFVGNRTVDCHYRARLLGGEYDGEFGFVSLCEDKVEGVLPLNFTHFGILLPSDSREEGGRRMRVAEWPTDPDAYVRVADRLKRSESGLWRWVGNLVEGVQSNLIRKRRDASERKFYVVSPNHVLTKRGPFVMELLVALTPEFVAMYNNEVQALDVMVNAMLYVNSLFRIFDLHVVAREVRIVHDWSHFSSDRINPEGSLEKELINRMVHYYANQPLNNDFDCFYVFHGSSGVNEPTSKVLGVSSGPYMCNVQHCAAITKVFKDHKDSASLGLTTTHELTHLFGIDHIHPNDCEHSPCVMVASYSGTNVRWSSNSVNRMVEFLDRGVRHCLMVPQSSTSDSALRLPKLPHPAVTCGNGMIDEGEECDCGGRDCENNTCCEPHTCRLQPGAECGGGACCDLRSCRLKQSGTECRPAMSECDLPEFCNGENFWCPTDVFKHFGTPCKDGDSCSNGTCVSRTRQCKLLWGEQSQVENVYSFNHLRNMHDTVPGCGYIYMSRNRIDYTFCEKRDSTCGRLFCSVNSKLDLRSEGFKFAKPDNYYRAVVNNKTALVGAEYRFGYSVEDPGMTPFGSKCGDNKLCISGRCLELKDMQFETLRNCSNGGILNSRGNCHCLPGFHPPDCEPGGIGGSVDSVAPVKAVPTSVASHFGIFVFLAVVLGAIVCFCLLIKRGIVSLELLKVRCFTIPKLFKARRFNGGGKPSQQQLQRSYQPVQQPSAAAPAKKIDSRSIGSATLLSCTYSEPLTDRSSVSPQIRRPTLKPMVTPPSRPPKPPFSSPTAASYRPAFEVEKSTPKQKPPPIAPKPRRAPTGASAPTAV